MTSADFYIGTGPSATWIGHIGVDGSPAEMDDLGLFGGEADVRYTEATFRDVVNAALTDAATKEGVPVASSSGTRSGLPAQGERPAELFAPVFVYAFVTGSVHVFEIGTDMSGAEGMLLVAVHHPNGARKATKFQGIEL